MKKKVLSLLLATTMTAGLLAGCGSSDASTTTNDSADTKAETKADSTDTAASGDASVEQGKIVNIYCWNDEFKSRYEAYAADLAETHGVEVNFVIVANENNAYQNNLDAALMAQETAAADDKVEAFQQSFHEYFEGNVDMDTALENFYTSAVEKYPELTK